jgi:hypothetical protein
MVTAIRAPVWSTALAVIVPVAPLKAPVPPDRLRVLLIRAEIVRSVEVSVRLTN